MRLYSRVSLFFNPWHETLDESCNKGGEQVRLKGRHAQGGYGRAGVCFDGTTASVRGPTPLPLLT